MGMRPCGSSLTPQIPSRIIMSLDYRRQATSFGSRGVGMKSHKSRMNSFEKKKCDELEENIQKLNTKYKAIFWARTTRIAF